MLAGCWVPESETTGWLWEVILRLRRMDGWLWQTSVSSSLREDLTVLMLSSPKHRWNKCFFKAKYFFRLNIFINFYSNDFYLISWWLHSQRSCYSDLDHYSRLKMCILRPRLEKIHALRELCRNLAGNLHMLSSVSM